MSRFNSPIAISLLAACWLLTIGLCMNGLARYSSTPSGTEVLPGQLPADSRIHTDPQRATLLVFLHPHCPCSRATVSELDRLLSQVSGRVNAYAVVIHPAETPADWYRTTLWHQVSGIRDLTTIVDAGCELTRRCRATVSGQTLLYGADGALQFRGGITVARGHEGDSPGRSSILSFLGLLPEATESLEAECAVFGCPLFQSNVSDRPGELQ